MCLFYIISLYTCVPLQETIDICTDTLYLCALPLTCISESVMDSVLICHHIIIIAKNIIEIFFFVTQQKTITTPDLFNLEYVHNFALWGTYKLNRFLLFFCCKHQGMSLIIFLWVRWDCAVSGLSGFCSRSTEKCRLIWQQLLQLRRRKQLWTKIHVAKPPMYPWLY